VFGDNATIVVGDSNNQQTQNTVNKNDIASLIDTMKQHNVSDDDITSLQEAIEKDSDSSEVQAGKLGNGVSTWMGNMVTKAASTICDAISFLFTVFCVC